MRNTLPIKIVAGNSNNKFIKGDIINQELVEYIFAEYNIDYVVNFAVGNLQVGDEIKLPISDELDYYIVQPGDTLWQISQGTGIELDQIIDVNDLDNPDSLEVNQVLLLPEELIIVEDNNLKITQFSRKADLVSVAGLARAFEATINYALETETGQVLEDGFTTASAAGPYWGIFNLELTSIPAGADYLAVFTIDARDGSRQDEVKLRLRS